MSRRRDLEMMGVGAALARRPAPETNVTINQQPNDAADSARLYGEILAKARAEVLASVKVASTHFECVIDSMLDNHSDEMKYRAIFSMNGSPKMTADISVNRMDDRKLYEVFQKLADKTAEKIAMEILRPLFTKIHFDRFK